MSICLTAMPFYAFSISATAEVCQLNSHDQFQAKQGSIILDFSMHRAPDDLAVFEAIINKTESITAETVVPFQNWINKRNVLMNLSEQLQRASRLSVLIKQHQIAWIGVEYSRSEISSKDSAGRDDIVRFNVLNEVLKSANVRPDIAELALVMFAGSPSRFVWFNDLAIRQQVRLVPLDSDPIKAASQKILLDIIPSTDILDTALKYLGAEEEKRNAIFANLNKIAKSGDDSAVPALVAELDNFAELLKVIHIVFPEKRDINDFIVSLIGQKRSLEKNQKIRDGYVAGIALSQRGNGWISFGPDHAENLKKQLEVMCGQ